MQIGDWAVTNGMSDAFRELRDRGLAENLAEFDAFGFTVIQPEQLGTPELFERMRAAVLRVLADRTGVEHSLDGVVERGYYEAAPVWDNQLILYYLLVEEACFRDAICHPVLKPLLHMVLGPRIHCSSVASFVKSKGDAYGPTLLLHTDAGSFPEPLPGPGTYSHVVNTNFILTEYTAENGPLCVVPGSHRWCRHPKPGEGVEAVIPVEAPVGSVILFHGNLWHGGLPKLTDGLRLSVNCYFAQPYASTQEDYRGAFSPEILAEHGSWFAQLVRENDPMGWKSEGPGAAKFASLRL